MVRSLALLRAFMFWSAIKRVALGVGRPGIGFALVALLSLSFALVAQAQTDSGSGDKPTLTIARSHASVVKGEEVTFTITADRAPTADILVNVQVQVTVRERSLYQNKVIPVSLAAGERTIEFIAETGGSEVGEGTLTLVVSILDGSSYRLGDTPVAGVRVTDPPPAAGTRQGVPPAPAGFAARAVAEDSIAVSWKEVAGVSRYRLEEHLGSLGIVLWGVVPGQGSIVQTSAAVDGLASGTTYQYRVRAYGAGSGNATGWGAPSSSASATTQGSQAQAQAAGASAQLADPPAPDGFSASAPNHFTISARWNAVTGANRYRFGVWIHTIGYPAGWHYKYTTGTSYTWTGGIDRGTTYNISVAAYGDGSTYAAKWSLDRWGKVTTPRPAPPAPSGFSGRATGTRSISARWNAVTGANNYRFGVWIHAPGYPAGWHYKYTTGTSYTWTGGLAPGTKYDIRVSAHGDGHWLAAQWGPDSWEKVTTETPTPTPTPEPPKEPPPQPPKVPKPVPPKIPPVPPSPGSPPSKLSRPIVSIVPVYKPDRRSAEITWGEDAHAGEFSVEIVDPVSGAWVGYRTVPSTSIKNKIEVDLDAIHMGKGLAHKKAYKFRVKAIPKPALNPRPMDSDYSDTVIIVDTTIRRAKNIQATKANQIPITWVDVDDRGILGSDYSNGVYSFIVRDVSTSSTRISHTEPDWVPDNPQAVSGASLDSMKRITGLDLNKVYAIQLIYTVTKPMETNPTRVYAGRDMYFWTSSLAGIGGRRVGTFPMDRLPRHREFRYRICDTFAADSTMGRNWVTHINHAFMQWQKATDGWVTMVHDPTGCTDYSGYIPTIEEIFWDSFINPPPAIQPTRDDARTMIANLLDRLQEKGIDPQDYKDTQDADAKANEVMMIDDMGGPVKTFESVQFGKNAITGREITLFTELAKHIGYADCAAGCTVKAKSTGTSDIFLRRSVHAFKSNGMPRPHINLMGVDEIPFNTCPGAARNDGYNYPYSSLVHEVGHALGIRNAKDGSGQEIHHPTVEHSIMSYKREVPQCSPHPLDIMAIYALYPRSP